MIGKGALYGACLPLALGLRFLPGWFRLQVMSTVVSLLERLLAPSEALWTFLRFDRALYGFTTDAAVKYGRGIHPKHRLIRYHEFFKKHICPGETVLDVGCGIGAVAADIAEHFGGQVRVIGVDWEASSITVARAKYANPALEFRVCDVSKDFPSGQYNVILLSNVLEHLQDRAGFLRHIIQSARPSRLLIRVPMHDRDWRVPLAEEVGVDYRLDPTHAIEYTQEEFVAEMEETRLSVKALEARWGEFWAVAVPR